MADVAGAVAPQVSHEDLPDVRFTITGAAGADAASNPTVTIVERRWLAETKTGTDVETRTATTDVRHVELGNGMCADETVTTVEVYRYDQTYTLRAYEDWRFEVSLNDYLDWLNRVPDTSPVNLAGALSDPMSFEPRPTMGFDGRSFGDPPAATKVGSGWLPISQDPPSPPALVYTTTTYELGKPYPCPPGMVTGVSDQAVVHVQVLDADTGQPISGTVTTVGALMIMQSTRPGPTGPQSPATPIDSPFAVNQDGDTSGLGVVVTVGHEVTFTHTPETGWETVRNSTDETPATTVHLTAQNPDGTYLVVFYDRPIRILDEGLPPPPPPAPRAQGAQTPAPGDGSPPGSGRTVAPPADTPPPATPPPVETPHREEPAPTPSGFPTSTPAAPAMAAEGSALGALGMAMRGLDHVEDERFVGVQTVPETGPELEAPSTPPGPELGLTGPPPQTVGDQAPAGATPGSSEPPDVTFTTPSPSRELVITLGGESGSGTASDVVVPLPPATVPPGTAPSESPEASDGAQSAPPFDASELPDIPEPAPERLLRDPQYSLQAFADRLVSRLRLLYSWRGFVLMAVVFGLLAASIGAVWLLNRGSGTRTSTTAQSPAASGGEGPQGLRIGPPVTGAETYQVSLGSSVSVQTASVTVQSSATGETLSVDTLSSTGGGSTGASCTDYRKDITSTGVVRTQELFHGCTGTGPVITVTCTPGLPLFMTTWTVGASQPFTEQCVSRSSASSATSAGSTWTDSGSAGLMRVTTVGGVEYATVHRHYTRSFATSGAQQPTTVPVTVFDETSVYGLDRWQEIGTVTTTSVTAQGRSSASTSVWRLQGVSPAVLALLPAPVTTPGTPPPSAPFTAVTIPFNELSFGTAENICQQGGTLHLRVTILGIPAGTEVVIHMTGPGVPTSLSFQANPGQQFGQDFPIAGGGVWSDDIVSIGGRPPPSAGSHVTAPVAC